MANNNNNKILNVPNLRFPEFTGEWKKCKLGDVANLTKGVGISKGQKSSKGNPCILYGELYTTYKSEMITDIVSKTNIDSANLAKSKYNDVIIPSSGETAIDISTARCVQYNDVLLGGDLNIIRLNDGNDGSFFSYQLNGVRKRDIAKVAQGVSVVHLYGETLKTIKVNSPELVEQNKISSLLCLIDQRISTQNKIIEDLKKLMSAIIDLFYITSDRCCRLGDLIIQTSERNKGKIKNAVLSVSNKNGFVIQSEQFEDRVIASDDTSNYKIVRLNDFAYNPARINVGSIARLSEYKEGIVSPMYICFITNELVLPEYIEYFFETRYFYKEMIKRLEGSVRLCLSYESLCDIYLPLPSIEIQNHIQKRINTILSKIAIETCVLKNLELEKSFLLQQMFI